MRKFSKITGFFFGLLVFVLMSTAAHAAPTDTYRVTKEEETYILTSDTGEEIARESAFGNVLSALDKRRADGDGYRPCRLVFDGVTVTENAEFQNGTYELSGSVAFSGDGRLTVLRGGDVRLTGGTFSFTDGDGYIRVKDGTFTLSGATVTGGRRYAVMADYAASARICIESGRIHAASDYPAVYIAAGTLTVSGGTVENTAGYAVRSRSSFVLCGEPTLRGASEAAVLSEGALWLSDGSRSFSGTVGIRSSSVYEKGRAAAVIYGATAEDGRRVRYFDRDGAEIPLVFMKRADFTDETDFLSVYLPFTVRFYADGALLSSVGVLGGDVLPYPTAPAKTGYEFVGWYADREGKNPFDGHVTDDVSVYALYRLTAPTFTLSSVSFTYDGTLRFLSPENLSHPLSDTGTFSYLWERDGAETTYVGASYPVSLVADSGRYRCRITLTVGADRVTVYTPEVTVTVAPKKIDIPVIPSVSYNGKSQQADVENSPYYTVKVNNGGQKAGKYPVVLTLTDAENMIFSDGSQGEISLVFVIGKAPNRFTVPPTAADIYEGAPPRVLYTAAFGTGVLSFSASRDGEYLPDVPTTAGTYYVKVTVPETADYDGLVSEALCFDVLAVRPVAIRLDRLPDRTAYTAFDTFIPAGMELSLLMNDGTEMPLPLSDILVSYIGGDSFRYGDSAVFVSFLDLRLPVTVSVSRAVYDMSDVSFADGSAVYDGTHRSLLVSGKLPVGRDGIPLSVTYEGGGCDAGTYRVTATFVSDSRDYEMPAPMTATLTVTPALCRVTWENIGFVYNGQRQCPSATAVGIGGVSVPLSVSGGAVSAGEGYTATLQLLDGNYTPDIPTCIFSIRRAVYDMKNVSWSAADFVYDGTPHTVRLAGLPDGVGVAGYADATATKAGTYTATATLTYDKVNYECPTVPPCVYTVRRAAYDMGTVAFPALTVPYDGTVHYPVLRGTLPRGADGFVPTFSFDCGALHVSDGTVTVTVTFAAGSDNYETPAAVVTTVRILPKEITVSWSSLFFVYDGNAHLPTASSSETALRIGGSAVDAGEYVATADAEDSDYTVVNRRCSYRIGQAENAWTLPLSVDSVFEGRVVSYRVGALRGTPVVSFFADAEATVPVSPPTLPGTYYARASVRGLRNFKDMESACVAFTVFEVLPVSLSVTMEKNSFFAFDRLTPMDYTVTLRYNDESTRTLAPEDVTVSYPSADAFRFGDSRVTFSHGGFSVTAPVTVCRAVLDLSGVAFSADTFIYDGEEHTVTVRGLPAGVSPMAYGGNTVKNAGVYTVTCRLRYDTDNYEDPGILSHTVVVRPAVVSLPDIPDAVYDGTLRLAAPAESPLYRIAENTGGVHAGVYPLSLSLVDKSNYVWENSGNSDDVSLFFTVLPRRLSVVAEDVFLYVDDRNPTVSVRISDGVVAGDVLRVTGVLRDGQTYAVCDNGDYILVVTPGTVHDTGRLSPGGRSRLFFGVLILVLLLLTVFIVRMLHRRLLRLAVCRQADVPPLPPVPPAIPPVPPTDSVQTEEEDMPLPDDIFVEDTSWMPTPFSALPPSDDGNMAEPENETQEEPREKSQEETQEEPPEGVREDTETVDIANDDAAPSVSADIGRDVCAVDAGRADALLTDDMAGHLIVREREIIRTFGRRKIIINVDTLNEAFSSGERVDVNILKEKCLIPYDVAYLKVLARGVLDKPLFVYANDFSLSAVKMIALTGGSAVRVETEAITKGRFLPTDGKTVKSTGFYDTFTKRR